MSTPTPLRVLSSPDDQPDLTVGMYLDEWLWGKQALRPSTHASYETHVRRYLSPALGQLPLGALRHLHVERMYRNLAEAECGRALSNATMRRIHATLMSAMNAAVRRGLIERNPAATVELPKQIRPVMQAWTATEFAQFLAVIEGDRLHLLFVMLGLVGLRRGEAVALRWSDIDTERGSMWISRSAVRVKDQTVVGPPKSKTSIRTVALDEETLRRLRWHGARQRLHVLVATGEKREPDLVFTTREGEALDPAWVSRHFDRLQRQAGVRRIRLHDLRHTSASIGLASGESLLEVSRRLGHSSISVTTDIYSHISPEVAKASAERLASGIYRLHGHSRATTTGER